VSSSFRDFVVAAKAKADEVAVFNARPGKQWQLAFLSAVIGSLGLLPLTSVVRWFSSGPAPDGRTIVAVLCVLLIPFGILFAINALRGWPRLTLTGEGVRLDTSLGSRWAQWNSLSVFEIKKSYAGRFRKEVPSAVAAIVGANASKSWRMKKQFFIPDQFETPIADIVEKLNMERAAALGTAGDDTASVLPPEPIAGLPDFKIPWLTFALLLVLVLVFLAENLVSKTPGKVPLVAAAAVSRTTVLQGEWHRLFTAPLLHASVAHLVGNGIALLLGGVIIERLAGRLWFFALFVTGGLGGSLTSIALNGPAVASVGASGALMALFAGLFALSFHFPKGAVRRQKLQLDSLRILIPSLLPFLATNGQHIDYAAHFGGALTGGVLGWVMLRAWPTDRRIPQLRRLAVGLSLAGGMLVLVSTALAAENLSKYNIALIPAAEVPKTVDDVNAYAMSLAQRYPDDS
jgi:membrane associated rhomboid family serine protease